METSPDDVPAALRKELESALTRRQERSEELRGRARSSAPSPRTIELDDDARRELEALGYLGSDDAVEVTRWRRPPDPKLHVGTRDPSRWARWAIVVRSGSSRLDRLQPGERDEMGGADAERGFRSAPDDRRNVPLLYGAAVAAITLLALAVRSLGADLVFVDERTVVLYIGDAWHHPYRALASLDRLPWFLSFDLYTNFPRGAAIPSPPLYDMLLAGVTRLFAGDRHTLEVVAAWMPAVLGSLAVAPVAYSGRVLGGRRVALGAALLYAILPASAGYALVGYADHHGALTLLVALLFAAQLAAFSPGNGSIRQAAVVLCTLRTAMLVTWSGSLLYVGFSDGLLVVLAAVGGRRHLLRAVALGALASAALVLPFVLASAATEATRFSAVQLSYLHVWLCLGVAGWSGGLHLMMAEGEPDSLRSALRAAAIAVGSGGALALAALIATGALGDLLEGLRFLGRGDDWGSSVLEQTPLYSSRRGAPSGFVQLGAFAALVPLAPLAAIPLLRRPEARARGVVLLGWSALLGGLTILQMRFANEYAPVGAVAFALVLCQLSERAAARLGLRRAHASLAAGLLGLLLASPALLGFHWPFLNLMMREDLPATDAALLTPHGSAVRFAEEIHAVTPPTSGYLEPGVAPEYCLLASPNLGHILQYVARRPTAVNNFGPYVGTANMTAVQRFFMLSDEEEAWKISRGLGCRYVVTTLSGGDAPDSMLDRLHRADGLARRGRDALSHFRLIAEGPAGGIPIAALYRDVPKDARVPYKLFELVHGAQLQIEAPPGEQVIVDIELTTPLGRRLTWESSASADADGVARIRVPYATRTRTKTRARGSYRVRVGARTHHVDLTDQDVLAGRRIEVEIPDPWHPSPQT